MNNRRRGWFKSKQNNVLPFVSTWRTSNTSTGSSTSTQVKLPLISTGTYNFVVNWGDGNEDIITSWNQAQVTHTYSSSGDYTITISGVCSGFRFNNTGDRLKILTISQWGAFNGGNLLGVFYGCSNLNVTATDAPNFTGNSITNLDQFFRGCSSLTYNSSINSWDVSNITNISNLFFGCTLFNQPLNNWDVSNVTLMNGVFQSASTFNQPLNNWDVSGVTQFGITNNGMFQSAISFNQDISGWNTSAAITMTRMFSGASAFNQNIGGWNVSNVTNFSSMFQSKNGFTFSLNSWNTGSATDMSSMFASSNFNQNISSWNVSNVTTFATMFQSNTSFNQDISGWTIKNTGSVSMSGMFDGASSFNQNIGGWNTSRVTTMLAMFRNASAFNQDIGSWNVSLVTDFTLFMSGKTSANYSAANLDSIYNGWSSRPVQSGRTITFNTIKYTAAGSTGRAILTGSPNNWTITDGGI